MKKQNLKKIALYSVFGLFSFAAQAQISVGDIKGELESSKEDVFAIIDIIMSIIIMGGIIYVASALIAKREMSKGVIIGWVSAMALWGMAKALIE